jgi:ABC-type lipoprotein export system ATPase subunit
MFDLLLSNKALLIVGQTGTGKTSLVQCGFALKLRSTDAVQILIRREGDFICSAKKQLLNFLTIEYETGLQTDLSDLINQVSTEALRPVYLIFDQFEEIFINGTDNEELAFMREFRDVYFNTNSCKIVIVMREEYLARLYEFEDSCPEILENILRIGLVRKANAVEIVKGTFQALLNSHENGRFEIEENLENPESIYEKVVRIVLRDRVVHLPYLQVLLHKIVSSCRENENDVIITEKKIEAIGDLKDVLSEFLIEKTESLFRLKKDNLPQSLRDFSLEGSKVNFDPLFTENSLTAFDTNYVFRFLRLFVSDKKTKLQKKFSDLPEIVRNDENDKLKKHFLLIYFCNEYIMRAFGNDYYELAHDSLAPKILSFFERKEYIKSNQINIHGNPYKGLEAYKTEDKNKFYGRERAVRDLHQRILSNKFVVVIGNSGSGKSSLLKAGVLPRLEKQGFDIRAVMRPQDHALSVLKATLASVRKSEATQKVLVIDQFEELVTRTKPEDAEKFQDILAELLEKEDNNIHFVLTLRSDFEADFENEKLAKWWKKGRFIIPAFDKSDLLDIITGPAAAAGLTFEPEELPEEIAEEALSTSNALPLLSFALSALYETYKAGGAEDGILRKEYFDQNGGVLGGLKSRAEKIFSTLEKKSTAYVEDLRHMMMRLVSVDAESLAGRKVNESSLVFPDENKNKRCQEILKIMLDEGLLVRGQESAGESYIEPAHDVLVRRWDKVREWARDESDTDSHRVYDRVYYDSKDYFDNNQDEKLLWHEKDFYLDNMLIVLSRSNPWLNKSETEFILRSKQKRDEIKAEKKRKEEEENRRVLEAEKRKKTIFFVAAAAALSALFMVALAYSELEKKNQEYKRLNSEYEAKLNDSLNVRNELSILLKSNGDTIADLKDRVKMLDSTLKVINAKKNERVPQKQKPKEEDVKNNSKPVIVSDYKNKFLLVLTTDRSREGGVYEVNLLNSKLASLKYPKKLAMVQYSELGKENYLSAFIFDSEQELNQHTKSEEFMAVYEQYKQWQAKRFNKSPNSFRYRIIKNANLRFVGFEKSRFFGNTESEFYIKSD